MVDIILIGILLCIVGGIVLYLYKAKKRGEHCVGCPYARQCAAKQSVQHSCTGGCSCSNTKEDK